MRNTVNYIAFIALNLLLCTAPSFAQEIDLAADKIPDSLLKDARIVTRYEKQVFEVSDLDKATYKVHKIVTVLNERGRSELLFQHLGDKFHKLVDFDLKVYDANGKFVIKYKKKDLSTFNIGEGLIDDGIRHYLMVPASSYPITIETVYEEDLKALLGFPQYYFGWPYEATINSSFTAIVPKANGLRYKQQYTNLTPKVADDGKNITYTWSVNNHPAVKHEDGAVGTRKSCAAILLAPNKFKTDQYEGDLSTWKTFGDWYTNVIAGTDVLKDHQVAFYKNLVKDAPDDLSKMKIVYKFMQDNFRYVSIQLGIGGQKPLPASFTDDKKYGDCKGLSNYVRAVLKSLGIKSHMVLINRQANDEAEDPDFAISRFNHAILYIPHGKGIWLECTSKTLPFGMLDNGTQNKNALVVTDNGGVLMQTPASQPDENLYTVKTTIQLDEDGSGNCVSNIQATGLFKEIMLENVLERKRDEQKAFLVGYVGYKQPDDFNITRIADPYVYNTNIELAIEKIPEFTAGSKMFLATHIYKYWTERLPENETRQRDYFFDVPFIKSDTTVYKLPAGFILDQLPAPKAFDCDVAKYSSSFSYNETEKAIYSITRLELRKHRISPAQYPVTKQFFDKVLKEESQRIVIKKDPNQPPPPPRKAGF